jgi:autotransporter-associated beta strand protein
MKRFLTMGVCVCAAASAWAAERVMTVGNNAGTSSFNSGTNWDDNLPPSAGNNYSTAGYIMRTPEGTSDFVFAGDRLTVNSTGALAWKSAGPLTVADLVLEGTISHWYGGLTGYLHGNVTIPATRTARFDASQTEADTRIFAIYSTVSGSGNIQVTMGHSNALKQVSLLADNSGFTGRILLRGLGKFGIVSEEGLGANPAAFAANQMEFSGMTLILTNSVTLDDPNRGFLLNSTTNAVSQIYPGGAIEVAGAHTATVACVISGAGPLTKRGNGTLILATNNTYTGVTKVEAGTLRLKPEYTLASQTLAVTGTTAVVAGEGSLGHVTLIAGGRLAAEKGGWSLQSLAVANTTNVTFALDLAEANPATTLIRVSGALSKQPLQVFQFVVNTNNTTEVPYMVLSAPNLADFADCDFCVTPPWSGELSRADDGLGGQVLLFTPTPPDKIVFKVGSDPLNDTGFTNAMWSSGAPPTAGNTYVFRAGALRTPAVGSQTFPGKRLIVDASSVGLKGATGVPTITNLVMMNDASFSMSEGVGSRMAGDILLHAVRDANRTYAMRITGGSMGRHLDLYSTLAGYGDLFLQANGNPGYNDNPLYANTLYRLHADSPGFFGKLRVEGNSNFWVRIVGEEKLGANPPLFRADQLSFNGGGVSVTNDVTLDDSNRGITLLATGGTAATTTDPGGFTNGTPPELRRYEGGCTLRPESNNVTLTVSCPITGAGTLIKKGAGTLVLGGANTYTGQTLLVSGTLRAGSTNAFGAGPVLVKGAGTLTCRHPEAGLPNGVELGSSVTFEAGAQVDIVLNEGFSVAGNFKVPLFTVPSGVAIDPASVPVRHSLNNYKATVTTSTVGSRTLVSAQVTFQGSVMLVK